MSYRCVRGQLPRMSRRTRLRRVLDLIWKVLRAMLAIGAAFGPAVPPPPPPPPQTIEARVNDDSSEEEP
jgi:hypothetical protein